MNLPSPNLTKPVALYARVSTATQNVDGQLSRLEDYAKRSGFTRTLAFSDLATGRDTHRPGLTSLLKAVADRRVAVVMVESLDRLGRSARDLIFLCERFEKCGVHFVSVREAVDTSTAAGRFFFHVIGAFAELERRIIGERVKSGLETARARGIDLGRPPLATETQEKIRELRRSGDSVRRIAATLELSTSTVKKYLRAS